MSGKSILAVSAHPDDVEFTVGGSLARWISEGWKVSLIVCTDGGKGTLDPTIKPSDLAVLRREEQLAAARLLSIIEVFFLDFPDGELNKSPNLVSMLARYIRQVQPGRLVSWDPWHRYELHPDHRAAGQATLDAVLAAGNPHYFPELLDEGLHAHAVPEVYLFGAEQPDTWVDITAAIEQKINAIACHQSQMDRVSTLMNDLRTCNADYGKQGGFPYAEPFKVLHPFCDT
ncbi:MAG: PIG-L deacetylase family protein [Bellilinea sp.]